MKTHRILILGGTTEARMLAHRLSGRAEFDTTVSLAGRTVDPKPYPVPTRNGGFGGQQGLADFLVAGKFDLLVDATHPFANRISIHAAAAATALGMPLFALTRPAWRRQPGDHWLEAADVGAAAMLLGDAPRRVFLSIGRQEAHRFNIAPQHHYMVRSVDPVDPPLSVPHSEYLLATGPFRTEDEIRLLRAREIDIIVTKNSGGSATYGKIEAARALGLQVIMIGRQPPADVPTVGDAGAAIAMIDHLLAPE